MLRSLVWFTALAAAWTIEKGVVSVAGGGDVGERVSFAKLEGPVELVAGRSLDVAFSIPETGSGKPVPKQVAVRLAAAGAGPETVDKTILAKLRGKNAKAVVPYKVVPESLHNRPLEVSLLVSGGDSSTPIDQVVFDLIVYGDDEVPVVNGRRPGTGADLEAKPEIIYAFRPGPRKANFAVALVFVAAVDVLFGGLLLGWTQLLKSTSLSPSRVTVVTLVAALEAVFVAYYINWSIFSVISATSVLLPAVFVAARRAN